MPTEFKNLIEISKYLKDEGWAVSKSTVYDHAKAGYLGKKKNGVYTLRQIQDYCRNWLKTADAHQTIQDEDLAKKIRQAELDDKLESSKLKKIKREQIEGRLIPLDDVVMQLAGRAMVFETGLKGAVLAKAGDMVHLVKGDASLTGDLVTVFNELIDVELNTYAQKMVFDIAIKNLEDIPDEDIDSEQ